MHYVLTNHAQERMCQRDISQEEIDVCLKMGEIIYQRGTEILYLSKKICKKHDLGKRFQGIVVVMDRTGEVVVSVFRTRNRRYLHKISGGVKKRDRLSRRQLFYQQRLVQSAV